MLDVRKQIWIICEYCLGLYELVFIALSCFSKFKMAYGVRVHRMCVTSCQRHRFKLLVAWLVTAVLDLPANSSDEHIENRH